MSRSHRMVATTVAVAGMLVWAGPGLARAQETDLPGSFPVSVWTHDFTVGDRGTPARVGVPAVTTRTIHEVVYEPTGPVGQLPTVVFAPGWNAQSSEYDVMLRAIASAGYFVIGVDSPGTSDHFPGAPQSEDLANNTLDLTAALTDVESGPMGGRIDQAEVAAVGHSDGGSEVATLALDADFTSYRFNAYVVLSGIAPKGQVPGVFSSVNNGPLLAMVGTQDEFGNFTPVPGGGGTESVYATGAPSKTFVAITGATHVSAYTGAGPQAADTRDAIIDFLDGAESHDPRARARFEMDLSTDGLSAVQRLQGAWSIAPSVVGMAADGDGGGYWLAYSDGRIRSFGDAPYLGEPSQPDQPVVAMAGTADGGGYYVVTADGAVYAFGDAVGHGGVNGVHLVAPIAGIAADPATGGYWLLGGDGGVFSFDAPFFGSTGDIRLAQPAVGMAATPDGHGYYFVARDGGVFAYGDARFMGSTGGVRLNRPVVGMTVDRATGGYWLDASDGGIFAFNAPFEGSTGGVSLAQPCVSMAADLSGHGYWLVTADGGVFAFAAPFEGSAA